MDVNATTATTGSSSVKVVPNDKTGFNSLTSEDFMKLLIAQLQNQDPSEPVTNEELLGQISDMRSLQSNIEMGDALKAVTVNQRLSTAATFIGRTVTGTDANQQDVTGVADRAFLRDGQAFVGVGTAELSLDSVTGVGA